MKRACQRFLKQVVLILALLVLSQNIVKAANIEEIAFPSAIATFNIEKIAQTVFSNQVKLKKSTIKPYNPTLFFYKYDKTAKDFLLLPQTDYSHDGTLEGTFTTLEALMIEGKKIATDKILPMVKCAVYKRDEPLIVVLTDKRLKMRESVYVRIETDKDSELLKIKCIDKQRGIFVGYINTSTTKYKKCDGLLFVEKGTQIKVRLYSKIGKNRAIREPSLFAVAGVEIRPLSSQKIQKEEKLWISARISKKIARRGEYLEYTVLLQNRSENEIRDITIVNQLTDALVYQHDTFRIDGKVVNKKNLSISHEVIGSHIDTLARGEEKEISFIVYIGLKAKDEVICESFVQYNGTSLTYHTKAATKILNAQQKNVTLIGKIATEDNATISGVRLYLEDGTSVISDSNGKFHFENLSKSLHVISMDSSSFDGEATVCRENIRGAKSALSQFVDMRTVGIKEVTFCLKKGKKKKVQKSNYHYKIPRVHTDKMPNYTSLDIQKEKSDEKLLWPKEGYIPAMPSIKVAILHKEKEKAVLYLNGKKVDMLSFDGFIKGKDKKRRISKYRGLDLQKGDNKLTVRIYHDNGTLKKELTRVVHFTTAPVRAEVVKENSFLIADGKHSAVIAVRFYDASGYPLREGMVGSFTLEAPYISQERIDAINKDPLSISQEENRYTVGHDGIAYIKLKATSKSGEVKLHFPFQNKDEYTTTWLKAESREWFIAGFAEGTLAYKSIQKHMVPLQKRTLKREGRVAFFAKGKIKGDALLSLAYDSGKEVDLGLVEEIDPQSFYTVYGDKTVQNREAPTTKKLYIKLEKESFYAMFGDFDTGLDTTTLSKYTRRINGFKSAYKGENFSYNAFASKTENVFIKDEIRADGTSGLYRLTHQQIVYASEKVYLEVRDRLRPEVTLSKEPLTALLDYSMDYIAGTLYFKYPILSKDEVGNPRFIVIDYEVSSKDKSAFTYGGRGAVTFVDNRVELGASYIDVDSGVQEDSLYGFDMRMKIDEKTVLKAEYAVTHNNQEHNVSSADAYLVELTHRDKHIDARAYLKKQSDTFGLGQHSRNQNATQQYGVEGVLSYWKHIAIAFLAYHDRDLMTQKSKNIAEVKATYDNHLLLAQLGYRVAQEKGTTQHQLLSSVSKRFFANRLKVGFCNEYTFGDDTIFENTTALETSYRMNKKIELFAKHEIRQKEQKRLQLSRIGVKGRPWEGGVVDEAISHEASEDSLRLYNHLGFQQNVRYSKALSFNISLDREEMLEGGNLEGDFTSISLSTMYHKDAWMGNIKAEYKDTKKEDKIHLDASLYHKVSNALGMACGIRGYKVLHSTLQTENIDSKFSVVYRPTEGMVLLNRLDMIYTKEGSYKTSKIGNFFLLNMQLSRYFSLSTSYGLYYVLDSFGEERLDAMTDSIGIEGVYDITEKMALGTQLSFLHDYSSQELSSSIGAYIGYRLFHNTLMTLGYNMRGYEMESFTKQNETLKGIYLQMRMKFDQENLHMLATHF